MVAFPPIADDTSDDLGGDLITQADLAEQVAEDWDQDSPMVKALFDDLVRGEHAAAVLAEAQARQVAEFNRAVESEQKTINGLGQLVARMPLSVFLHWTAVYGHEFWNQPDSLDFILKRAGGGQGNPGLAVRTPPKATMVVERTIGGSSGPAQEQAIVAAGAPEERPAARPAARRGRWAL